MLYEVAGTLIFDMVGPEKFTTGQSTQIIFTVLACY